MDETWKYHILRCIDLLGGKADLKQIYKKIPDLKELNEDHYKEQWGRPAYHHVIRGYITDLCQSGDLNRISRGEYSLTGNRKEKLFGNLSTIKFAGDEEIPSEYDQEYQQREKEIEEMVALDLEALQIEEEHFEGKQRERYTNYYERDPKLRAKAISLHGTKCMACDFDFEKKYGERGKGFIEVHHLKPVSELGGNTKVDPDTDLTVVCSNCHKMIHRKKNEVLSLAELMKIIQSDYPE
jgi:5-methylcytosine-specific restriction protein A